MLSQAAFVKLADHMENLLGGIPQALCSRFSVEEPTSDALWAAYVGRGPKGKGRIQRAVETAISQVQQSIAASKRRRLQSRYTFCSFA